MDAGTADTLNRRDAALMVARADAIDLFLSDKLSDFTPWHLSRVADMLLNDADALRPDKAWTVGHMAAGIPGLHFDGEPADGDWDNLFSHIRAEIEARRNPRDSDSSLACAAETPALGMV